MSCGKILGKFGEILGDFATISALSCGENWAQKVHLWRQNDKYEVWMGTQYSSAALAIPCFCLKLYNFFFHTETLQQSIILPSTAWNRLLAIHQMRRQPNLTKPTWKNIYPDLLKRNNELIYRFLVIQKIHKKNCAGNSMFAFTFKLPFLLLQTQKRKFAEKYIAGKR